MIIALGESLIVAGTAVSGDERTADLIAHRRRRVIVCLPALVDVLRLVEGSPRGGFAAVPAARSGRLARDAYSLGHFPLVCGIIGVRRRRRGDRPPSGRRRPPTAVVASLGVGIGLFVGASALACWRITRRVLTARLVIVAVTIGVVAVLADADPVWPLTVVAVGLLAIVVTEEHTIDAETSSTVVID